MWKWILRGVLALSHNPDVQRWVRAKAKLLIGRARARVEARVKVLADAVGIAVPDASANPSTLRLSQVICTKTESLKPGNLVQLDGSTYRITRLLRASADECVYEAELV